MKKSKDVVLCARCGLHKAGEQSDICGTCADDLRADLDARIAEMLHEGGQHDRV